uniref:SWIM-type domain-containing protein n=1 Tax=Cacopsylla melanoneura TaxID=428564 RepID=A0A8D8QZQ0_9HEMI
MNISEEIITNILANIHWIVKSESSDKEYAVQRCATSCVYPDWCYFKCISPLCQGLCSHMFVCTCPDESPLCKHIHKVHAMCVHYGHQQPVIQPLPSIVSPSFDNLVSSLLPSSSEENNNCISSLPGPSLNAPKPSQTNTNKLKDIGKELMERINYNRIPQILIPHVTGVLSQLLAECRTVEESTNTERIYPMVPTQKRSSTQKLTCQVLPKKKKKQLRKSNYPTAGEKRDILNSVMQENSDSADSDVSDSDNELSNLIIEEEYYEEN